MIQNKKRIISLILMLTLLVSSLVVGAITASATGEKTYEKVTSAPTDWSGEYLIVYEDGSKIFDGNLTTLDCVSNNQGVDITNNSITTSNAYSFTIAKSGSNYTIQSASGYYIGQTSNANGLKSNTSTTYANTISLNADGSVNIVSGGAYLRFNNSNNNGDRFRYYKSSSYTNQQAIQLYKLVDAGCECEYSAENINHTWANDYSSCSVVAKCSKCSTEVKANATQITASNDTATCTAGGKITYTAIFENNVFNTAKDKETAALGHNVVDGVCNRTGCDYSCEHEETGAIGEAKNATCTENGISAGLKCTNDGCNTVIEEQIVLLAGHKYVDGVCSVCEKTEPTKIIIAERGWINDTRYDNIIIDNKITITAAEGGNNGKYFTTDNSWRLYEKASGTITITANEHERIKTVEITYISENGGVLMNGNAYVGSDYTLEVNSNTVTLSVAQNGTYEDGAQVRITAISVVYCDHSDYITTTEPTCTEEGSFAINCENCGYSVNEVIPATGHKDTEETVVAATCTTTGTRTVYCNDCETTIINETLPYANHNYGDDNKCINCNAKLSSLTSSSSIISTQGTLVDETISWVVGGAIFTNNQASSTSAIRTSDSDHFRVYAKSEIIISGKNITKVVITCTSSTYATPCAATFNNFEGASATIEGSVVTVTLDNPVDEIKVTATAQIRLNKIEITYSCAHNGERTSVVTAPTCGAEGYTTFTCTICNHTYTGNATEATGNHAGTVINGGTADVHTKYSCCDVIVSSEHSYSENVTAPTFDAQGYTTYTCECGYSYKGNYVDAKVAVAIIGETKYESLQEALDAATDDDTIVLCQDVQADKYLDVYTADNGKVARSFTLDLNGHTISPADGYNYNTGYPLVFVGINQTLTIVGEGTITAEKKVTVGVYGFINIADNNVTIANGGTTEDDAALGIYYWNNDLPSYEGIVGGTGNITGGNFEGLVYTDDSDEDGGATLEISGGTFTNNIGQFVTDNTKLLVKDSNGNFVFTDDSFEVALNNYKVIVLNSNVEYNDAITLANGMVIDLNGHNLKAAGVVNFGDAEIVGEGLIVVDENKLIGKSADYLALWTTVGEVSGYALKEVKDLYKGGSVTPGEGETNKYTVEFRPAFLDGSHFGTFSVAGHGVAFSIKITAEDMADIIVPVGADVIQKVYAEKRVMKLNLKNAALDTTYNIYLVMTSGQAEYVDSLGTITDGTYAK